MATDVVMPQMGESIAEGTIVRWLRKVGDRVQRDEPLLEISTDKVDAEIPAPASGTLTEILAQEGQTVGVNSVIARIDGGDAAPATPPPPPPPPPPHPPPPPPPPQAPAPAAPPHAPTVFEVDFTNIEKLRQQYKDVYAERGAKLTYLPFIVQAVVAGLREFPILNASMDESSILYHRDYNVGIAVALDWGLIVPV